jgi:hypothetical protein
MTTLQTFVLWFLLYAVVILVAVLWTFKLPPFRRR